MNESSRRLVGRAWLFVPVRRKTEGVSGGVQPRNLFEGIEQCYYLATLYVLGSNRRVYSTAWHHRVENIFLKI